MWKVIGACVTGTSHEVAGTGCQDAVGWQVGPDVTCLAVADGAGSRALSGRGAELAVERALLIAGACGARPDAGDPESWLPMIVRDIREEIAALAHAQGHQAGDYATTLGVAILTRHATCVGQVGDTIAVLGGSGTFRTVAPAPPAEYVNETVFVTDDDALGQLRITTEPADEVDAVFLSTDGLRFKVLDSLATAAPFEPFFADLTAYVRASGASGEGLRRFLGRVDDQSGDDKSLIAAIRTDTQPAEGAGGATTSAAARTAG